MRQSRLTQARLEIQLFVSYRFAMCNDRGTSIVTKIADFGENLRRNKDRIDLSAGSQSSIETTIPCTSCRSRLHFVHDDVRLPALLRLKMARFTELSRNNRRDKNRMQSLPWIANAKPRFTPYVYRIFG